MATYWLVLAALLWGLVGCDDSEAARNAQQHITAEHIPRMVAVIDEDMARHKKGLTYAADRVAAGFVKAALERIEHEMRQVLKLVRSPKKGVSELVISPMSFMAAVDKRGVVICRDAEPDKMKGMNLAQMFPEVKKALAGQLAWGMGEFANEIKGGDPSVTMIMAAPAHYNGEVVGAITLGIPMWRLAQRLSKQLQAESSKNGVVLWVYVYRNDKLYHHGTPPDLDLLVPDHKARKAALAKSPKGYLGSVSQYGYDYGYGVQPIPILGEDAGIIVFRMDPNI